MMKRKWELTHHSTVVVPTARFEGLGMKGCGCGSEDKSGVEVTPPRPHQVDQQNGQELAAMVILECMVVETKFLGDERKFAKLVVHLLTQCH